MLALCCIFKPHPVNKVINKMKLSNILFHGLYASTILLVTAYNVTNVGTMDLQEATQMQPKARTVITWSDRAIDTLHEIKFRQGLAIGCSIKLEVQGHTVLPTDLLRKSYSLSHKASLLINKRQGLPESYDSFNYKSGVAKGQGLGYDTCKSALTNHMRGHAI